MRTILLKDLRMFFAAGGQFWLVQIFSLILLLMFRFALPVQSGNQETAVMLLAGIHLIASVFLLQASQSWEFEASAWRAVRLIVGDASVVFVAKSAANYIVLSTSWFGLLGVWWFTIALPAMDPGARTNDMLIMILYLAAAGTVANAGLALAGQLMAGITVQSSLRELLTAVLFLPGSLPIVIALADLLRASWLAIPGSGPFFLMIAYALIYGTGGYLLFPYIWEE